MRRPTLQQMVAMATLLGRHAKFESDHPRVIKPSRRGKINQDQECARRRRQMAEHGSRDWCGVRP